jgi:hypothetical protein
VRVVLLLAFVGLSLGACAGQGFERGLAASVTHKGDVGLRGALGMPRGENGWVTQLVLAGESSGFLAAAGGVAWRKPTMTTPRFEIAAGVATRSTSTSGDCVIDDVEGTETCTNGIGPYGEATLGLDVPLGEGAPALTFGALGTLYLNSDQLESRLVLAVGVVWK